MLEILSTKIPRFVAKISPESTSSAAVRVMQCLYWYVSLISSTFYCNICTITLLTNFPELLFHKSGLEGIITGCATLW